MTSPLVCARCKATFTPAGYHEEKQEQLKMCPTCLTAYEALVKMLDATRPLKHSACGNPIRVYSILPVHAPPEGFPSPEVYSIPPSPPPPVCETCADRADCTYKRTRVGEWRMKCATFRKE